MQCRAHVAQLGRLYREFQSQGAEVLVILGDIVQRAQRYVEALHLPFPVLADSERQIYHQYGLGRDMLIIQRTASSIVDQAGTIRYFRRATNPSTWLQESQELLQAVHHLKEQGILQEVNSNEFAS
jgi:peroxiredoxin Q/BCP